MAVNSSKVRDIAPLVHARGYLDQTKLETAWLCAGHVPANARNRGCRLNKAPTASITQEPGPTRGSRQGGDSCHRPSLSQRCLLGCVTATIKSALVVRASLDTVVLMRHDEPFDSPTQNLLENRASPANILNCETEVH